MVTILRSLLRLLVFVFDFAFFILSILATCQFYVLCVLVKNVEYMFASQCFPKHDHFLSRSSFPWQVAMCALFVNDLLYDSILVNFVWILVWMMVCFQYSPIYAYTNMSAVRKLNAMLALGQQLSNAFIVWTCGFLCVSWNTICVVRSWPKQNEDTKIWN